MYFNVCRELRFAGNARYVSLAISVVQRQDGWRLIFNGTQLSMMSRYARVHMGAFLRARAVEMRKRLKLFVLAFIPLIASHTIETPTSAKDRTSITKNLCCAQVKLEGRDRMFLREEHHFHQT